MGKFTRLLLFLVIIVGAIWLYVRLHRPSQGPEQFNAVANLTPDDLKSRCGTPENDTSGVVADGAGIRDLIYRDSNSNEIVFRFITEDDSTWESLGAWEQVNAPKDLGTPVDALEAARRMPCAAKTGSNTASLFSLREAGAAGGWTTALAVLVSPQEPQFQEPVPPPPPEPAMPPPMPAPMPAPMPSPMPAPPMPAAMPSAMPAALPPDSTHPPVGRTESPGQGHSRGSEPDLSPNDGQKPGDGLGPGGEPPEAPQAANPVVLPCPSDADPCEWLSYAQFAAEMNQAIEAERANDFQAALDQLTQHGVILVQLPALEVDRAAAVKAIAQLEVKAINIVEARLRDDVAKLVPFQNDSADEKAQKMAVVQKDDQERRQLWKQSVESNSSQETESSSSGGNLRFKSEAYQQAMQIHLTGNWPQ